MAIQIEQRLNRCTRCGRMLQASAKVIIGEGQGRNRQLFCSERCQREYAEMQAGATSEAIR